MGKNHESIGFSKHFGKGIMIEFIFSINIAILNVGNN